MNKYNLIKAAKYVFIFLMVCIALFPFVLVFFTSFKTHVDAIAMPPKWLFSPTLKNYIVQFTNREVLKATKNSVIIGVSATIISTCLGVCTGYIISRFKNRWLKVLSQSTLWLRIVPPISLVIPYFIIWYKLDKLDTYLSLIVMYVVVALPLITWMMISFFQDVPVSVEESAQLDGCTRLQILRYVVIPMVLPGIFAASSLAFIGLWNEFLFAVFITGEKIRTLPIELYNSLGVFELDWGRLSSIAVFSIIPPIVFIAFTQKYLVRGLTMGAIKE